MLKIVARPTRAIALVALLACLSALVSAGSAGGTPASVPNPAITGEPGVRVPAESMSPGLAGADEVLRLVGTTDIPSAATNVSEQTVSDGNDMFVPRRAASLYGENEFPPSEIKAPLVSAPNQPRPLAPPTVGTGFIGLGSSDNPFGLIPGDVQLAAGPTYIIEMDNVMGRVLDKSGAVQQTFSMGTFFGVTAGFANFDPKIIYDATSGRFFATYVSLCDNASLLCATDTGVLHIAVSTDSNPLTQPWKLYVLTMTNDFPDYPGIGVTDDKFTASYNRFDIDGPPGAVSAGCSVVSGYCGVQILVAQKSDLVAGVASPAAVLTAADLTHFTIRPAQSLTSTTTQYMGAVGGNPATTVHLWRITGTPAAGNVVINHIAHPAIGSLTSPCPGSACAQQSGTSSLIDSGDNRVLEAVWRTDSMWLAATGACNWPGDTATRSCLKLIEVNTTTNTVTQDFMFGAFGAYYYYAAIRTDAGGNLHVVYTRSSSSEFAHVRIAGRLATDAPNTMSGDTVLKAGEIAYLPGFTSPPYRWGDYSGAALDPSDPSVVWVAGEYAKDDGAQRWGTWIGKLQFDTDADSIPDVSDNCPNWANPAQALPAWLIDTDDPDCDGYSSAEEATIGTDPILQCSTSVEAWPPDLVRNGTINILDVTALKPVFGQDVPAASSRYDIAPSGDINILDVTALKPYFGKSCS